MGYAIDLGLPAPGARFNDPEIKVEAMWTGETLGRANLFAERRGPNIRLRDHETGAWKDIYSRLATVDSMVTHGADPKDGFDLLILRERMRDWRFYDNLRTDLDAPARKRTVATYTPVLAADGGDLGAALANILFLGNGKDLHAAVVAQRTRGESAS